MKLLSTLNGKTAKQCQEGCIMYNVNSLVLNARTRSRGGRGRGYDLNARLANKVVSLHGITWDDGLGPRRTEAASWAFTLQP